MAANGAAAAACAAAAAADAEAAGAACAVPPLVRAFLREEYAAIDPALPPILDALSAAGAGECWHKKSTFKAHLFEVYKMLTLWRQDTVLRHCGLLHSAYSK